MLLQRQRMVFVFPSLLLVGACSVVTGSNSLDFSREKMPGDESGGSSGDGDGMGGESSGGSVGDGDGDGSGGVASGGMNGSGGDGSGGGGQGGSTFSGISYEFDTDLEGWWLQPDAFGWNEPPNPAIQDAVMRATMKCNVAECEAIYFVILDPRAPADNLQLFAGFTIDTQALAAFSCQFGFTCDQPVDWLWSAAFDCDDLASGLDAWEAHRDANSSCSMYRFGIRLTTSEDPESAVVELDYLSLYPPE